MRHRRKPAPPVGHLGPRTATKHHPGGFNLRLLVQFVIVGFLAVAVAVVLLVLSGIARGP